MALIPKKEMERMRREYEQRQKNQPSDSGKTDNGEKSANLKQGKKSDSRQMNRDNR